MDLSSTIVALSTAPGRSARAVVRMSGAGVFEVLEGVLALDLDGGVEPRAEGHEDSAPPSPLRGSADKGDRGPRAGSDAPMRGLRKRGVYVARMRLAGIGAEPAAGAALPAAAVSQASVEATAGADLPADVEIPAGAELPVLVVSLPGPRSYTGEDSVEILLPGSPALVDLVLEELLALPGVRAAEPGEFSARAYLNGRLSLEQAEGVAQRIAAESGAQLGAADRLLSGEAGQEEAAWARRLARALALVEAGVDFTDQEDVHPISAPDLRAQLEALQSEIDARLGGRHAREADDALPLVALVGRPNAGKSTLLNALLGRQRAVTSPEPGATRDALAETIDLSADAPLAGEVMLVDLPGLEAAPEVGATGAASEAQQNLLGTLERADALIWCDPAARFDVDELPAAAGALRAAPVIRVRTMADLGGIGLSRDGGTQATSEGCGVSGDSGAGPAAHVPICALDGFGLSDLRRAIARAIGAGSRGGEAVLLAPRRRRALVEARAGLHNALAALHEGPAAGSIGAPEVVAAEMRAALDALGALTGQISPDEVLGEVFRSFCVGK